MIAQQTFFNSDNSHSALKEGGKARAHTSDHDHILRYIHDFHIQQAELNIQEKCLINVKKCILFILYTIILQDKLCKNFCSPKAAILQYILAQYTILYVRIKYSKLNCKLYFEFIKLDCSFKG